MANTTPREVIESLVARIAEIQIANGYKTELGLTIKNDQGRVLDDNILSSMHIDTVEVIDDSISWTFGNECLNRVQSVILGCYVFPTMGATLHDKIYDVLEDFENFTLSFLSNSMQSPDKTKRIKLKLSSPKAKPFTSPEGRDIAYIEFSIELETILSNI